MFQTKSFVSVLALCCSSVFFVAMPSFSQVESTFTFSPLEVNFATTGQRATQSFLVSNTGKKAAAIQVRIVKREMDIDGKDINTDAEDDFIVYPPQMLVKAGERQTIRVTWVGNTSANEELSYRIIAEQLPVDLTEITQTQGGTTVSIKVLFAYIGSVYVVPPNVSPDVLLESSVCQPETDKAGKTSNKLLLTFANRGTAHAILNNPRLSLAPISSPSNSVVLEAKQILEVAGKNILAGSKRRFSLPCPAGLPNGKLTSTFDYYRGN